MLSEEPVEVKAGGEVSEAERGHIPAPGLLTNHGEILVKHILELVAKAATTLGRRAEGRRCAEKGGTGLLLQEEGGEVGIKARGKKTRH